MKVCLRIVYKYTFNNNNIHFRVKTFEQLVQRDWSVYFELQKSLHPTSIYVLKW